MVWRLTVYDYGMHLLRIMLGFALLIVQCTKRHFGPPNGWHTNLLLFFNWHHLRILTKSSFRLGFTHVNRVHPSLLILVKMMMMMMMMILSCIIRKLFGVMACSDGVLYVKVTYYINCAKWLLSPILQRFNKSNQFQGWLQRDLSLLQKQKVLY